MRTRKLCVKATDNYAENGHSISPTLPLQLPKNELKLEPKIT